MTDFLFGQLKPNWTSNTGFEAVTSNFEYITITTAVDIRPVATALLAGQTVAQATASQNNLNKLLEVVSLRGQPVIMGNVAVNTPTSGLFQILLATEHAGGWFNVNTAAGGLVGITAPNSLISRIVADGVNYGFGVDTTTGNTAVTAAAVTGGTLITLTTSATAKYFAGDTFTGGTSSGGVIQEITSPTSFIATTPQTIANTTTLTFLPALGTNVNDTPGTGLFVTFSGVMT
jgi:hypothetical protein